MFMKKAKYGVIFLARYLISSTKGTEMISSVVATSVVVYNGSFPVGVNNKRSCEQAIREREGDEATHVAILLIEYL